MVKAIHGERGRPLRSLQPFTFLPNDRPFKDQKGLERPFKGFEHCTPIETQVGIYILFKSPLMDLQDQQVIK